jgi:hypothetical protein
MWPLFTSTPLSLVLLQQAITFTTSFTEVQEEHDNERDDIESISQTACHASAFSFHPTSDTKDGTVAAANGVEGESSLMLCRC